MTKEVNQMHELEAVFQEAGNVPDGVVVHDNSITFHLQEGPIMDVGVNGCQVDEMIAAARRIVEFFNKRYDATFKVKVVCRGHITS